MALCAVRRSIMRTFVIPTAVWPAIDAASSRSSGSIGRWADIRRASTPTSSSAATSGTTRARPPVRTPQELGHVAAVAAVSRRPGQLDAHLGGRERRLGGRGVGPRRTAPEPAVGARDHEDLARLGVEEALRAAGHRGEQLLERRGRRHGARQVGQPLDQRQPSSCPLVEAGVLDRARDQARRVHHEVRVVLRELAGRLRVKRDDADDLARLAPQGDGDERLVAILLGLGHDLGSRVGERPFGEEHRLVVLGHPSGQPLALLEPEPADERGVRIGHRAQHQRGVGLDHVDEAGVAVDGVGDEVDDGPEHAVQVERRRDGVDDPVQVARVGGPRRGVRCVHCGHMKMLHVVVRNL